MHTTITEIYRVRGIAGTCYPDKMSAEIAAREEFPDEHPDLRYARVYYLRMEAPRHAPAHAKTRTYVTTVTGYDENAEDDTFRYTFATRAEAKAFMREANHLNAGRRPLHRITWRASELLVYAQDEALADLVENTQTRGTEDEE